MNLVVLAAALFVVDGHADTPQFLLDLGTDLTRSGEQMVDLPKARQGRLGAEFFSIWVDPEFYGAHPARRALDLIDAVHLQLERHPRELAVARTSSEVLAARKAGKLAVLMGVEGGHALEGDLRMLRTFHRLGVRYMTLTWSNTNELGDSSGDAEKPDVKHHGGLTALGRQAVEEMNRLGMLVDVSHVADRTFFDALEVSKAPVIASHSSCRALTDHPRNMTDEMLRAVAKNGGVVMVNFFSGFVDESFRKAFEALRPEEDKALAAINEKYKDDPAARTKAWFTAGREIAPRRASPSLPLPTLRRRRARAPWRRTTWTVGARPRRRGHRTARAARAASWSASPAPPRSPARADRRAGSRSGAVSPFREAGRLYRSACRRGSSSSPCRRGSGRRWSRPAPPG